MKLQWEVKNPRYGRSSSEFIPLPGYPYSTDEVINDFKRVIEFHELRYSNWKSEYIAKWGQDKFNDILEAEKHAEEQSKK